MGRLVSRLGRREEEMGGEGLRRLKPVREWSVDLQVVRRPQTYRDWVCWMTTQLLPRLCRIRTVPGSVQCLVSSLWVGPRAVLQRDGYWEAQHA